MKILIFLIIPTSFIGIILLLISVQHQNQPRQVVCTMEAKLCPDGSAVGRTGPNCEFSLCPTVASSTKIFLQKQISPPISYALTRVTKKTFGLKVSPGHSPISPEKFSGYHTGVDFEILPGEENEDVSVSAICSGTLLMKKWANGYGGVAVEECQIDGQAATVIYGHLKLASISLNVGEKVFAAEKIGILGKGYSSETAGERKHLHLGIHKGSVINILGYVQKPTELEQWLDVLQYL